MTDHGLFGHLMDEIEETLEFDGWVSPYEFSWILRGFDDPPTEAEIDTLVRAAYAEINRRHELRLVWMGWPEVYLQEVDQGVDVDFSLHESGHHMVLVPASWRAP